VYLRPEFVKCQRQQRQRRHGEQQREQELEGNTPWCCSFSSSVVVLWLRLLGRELGIWKIGNGDVTGPARTEQANGMAARLDCYGATAKSNNNGNNNGNDENDDANPIIDARNNGNDVDNTDIDGGNADRNETSIAEVLGCETENREERNGDEGDGNGNGNGNSAVDYDGNVGNYTSPLAMMLLHNETYNCNQ